MKTKILFAIDLKFDLTINEQLKELSVFRLWDKGIGKYFYSFDIKDLDKVIRLTGKDIEFDEHKEDILNILQHTPTLKKDIGVDRWKGKGYLKIEKFTKLFIVHNIVSKRPKKTSIPLESVKAAWRAVKKLPLDKSTPFKNISEKYCNEIGIAQRFTRETGSFDSHKFFGMREDTAYFTYNLCMKILQSEGVIDYAKSGHVTRLKDKWEYQGEIL